MIEHEKIYRSMKITGAFSIVMGIVLLVIGVAVGIGNLICGIHLLKKKSDITF